MNFHNLMKVADKDRYIWT